MMTRQQHVVYVQTMWMLVVVVVLSEMHLLSPSTFFIISLIGFFTLVEVTTPVAIQPQWRTRLRIVALLALCLFVYLVITATLERLPRFPF